jgi:hypothetical protein
MLVRVGAACTEWKAGCPIDLTRHAPRVRTKNREVHSPPSAERASFHTADVEMQQRSGSMANFEHNRRAAALVNLHNILPFIGLA